MTFNAVCCYAECRYADCRHAECRYAECRGSMVKRAYLGKLKVLGLKRVLLVDTQINLFVCLSKMCRNSIATYFPNTLA